MEINWIKLAKPTTCFTNLKGINMPLRPLRKYVTCMTVLLFTSVGFFDLSSGNTGNSYPHWFQLNNEDKMVRKSEKIRNICCQFYEDTVFLHTGRFQVVLITAHQQVVCVGVTLPKKLAYLWHINIISVITHIPVKEPQNSYLWQ